MADPLSDPSDDTFTAAGSPWPFGRCDTCGHHCDEAGCTADARHPVALP